MGFFTFLLFQFSGVSIINVFYFTDENKDLFPNKFEVSVEDEDTILTNVQQESDEVGG